jgi:hypothetical protein
MNANSAIRIGSTHSVCQDYVIARNDGPYVILSDGCSSSPDTDVGSRLLVRGAEIIMNECLEDVEQWHKEAARLALDWAALLGLPVQSVDATLLTAHVSGDELIIACSGDGVVVLESWNGSLDVQRISSPTGYPFYPCYDHQSERLAEFRSKSDSSIRIFKLKARDYKYAAVASDGVDSFFRKQQSANGKRTENVPLRDVIHELWSFKNSHGAFVERRLNRFTKDAQANGWQHADDLSIGVIYLGEDHVRS